MDTFWMLLGRYQSKPIIDINRVCEDFFPHLSPAKFIRKVEDGTIRLPVVKIESSQKCTKGVYVRDLATYLDDRHQEAVEQFHRLHS
jgi:hypothetical protein